jgi:DNA (cytosine-5)-methyltransferase 1
MRIGSLFSGASGLDRAVEEVFGGEVVWHSEIDKAASKVLAHRFPGVPNLGDITAIEWNTVEPIDILCGGFPCTDVSAAGKRAGMHGTRSGLWTEFAKAIDILRPRMVVIENVRGLLSAHANRPMESDDVSVGDGGTVPVLRAAGAVLGDLSDIGYDAVWATIPASAVGAPHRRERVFIVATDTTVRGRDARITESEGLRREPVTGTSGDRTPTDTDLNRPGWNGFPAQRSEPAQSSVEGGQHSLPSVCKGSKGQEGVDLLPTPLATDGTDGPVTNCASVQSICDGSAGRNPRLSEMAAGYLLPTPTAALPHDGWTVEQFDEWKRKVHAEGRGANGLRGDSLEIAAIRLLPTPTTQDGANNGGPSQFERNTLPLNAEVMLLPTPAAADGSRGQDYARAGRDGSDGDDLVTALVKHALLPTPAAQDGNGGGRYSSDGHQSTLPGEVRLLPTPSTFDGGGSTLHPDRRKELNPKHSPELSELARHSLTQWGKYEPAIRRWEQIAGPAPAPTEPNKNGNPRLSALFSEWLMGWPAGWVTDPAIGISRNDQLRIVGNGVCPQQAAAAMRQLLAVAC